MMEKIKVCKFGGSSFTRADNVVAISHYLENMVAEGSKVIAVISAPSGLTERLRQYILESSGVTVSPDVDTLINLSDFTGATILHHNLSEIGVRSSLGDGRDTGILTDGSVGGANVVEQNPEPLFEALSGTDVLVLPGGQGYYGTQCSWLGKNSSDYSAVLIAGMLGLNEVQIHSDVSHVFDKDPNGYADARPLEVVDYETLITAGQYGAKVLHPKAVREAMDRGVRIRTALNETPFTMGTTVSSAKTAVCITVKDSLAKVITFINRQASQQAKERLQRSQFFPLCSAAVNDLKADQLIIPFCYLNPIELLDDMSRPLHVEDVVFEHQISDRVITSRLLRSRTDSHASARSALL